MAEGRTFVCNRCGTSVESWDEGHPYYIDDQGHKQYPHADRDSSGVFA